MAILASDQFTGGNTSDIAGRSTDSGLGGSAKTWATSGGDRIIAISSGAAVEGTGSTVNTYGFDAGTGDVFASVTVTAVGVASQNIKIIVRQDANLATVTHYRAQITTGGALQLQKCVAGTVTDLGAAQTWTAGDVIGVQAHGSTIALWKNGVPIVVVTDTAITSANTRVGLRANPTATFTVDNFYVSDPRLTLVASSNASSTASGGNRAFPVTPANGDLIVVMGQCDDSVADCTLTQPGNPWNVIYSLDDAHVADRSHWFLWKTWLTGDPTTYTFTLANGGNFVGAIAVVRGAATGWRIEPGKQNNNDQSGTGTSTTPGTTGTLDGTEHIVFTYASVNSGTAGVAITDGFTTIPNGIIRIQAGYLITSATTALNPTISWTNTVHRIASIAAFQSVPVTAVLAAALGALTATAIATPDHPATLAAPLGGLVAAATATPDHPATLAAPLGALTANADATVTPGGTTVDAVLDAPLGALVAAAAAALDHPAALTADLGSLVAAVDAGVAHAGTFAAPLGDLTATAAAIPEHSASLAAPLGELTAAVIATPTVEATAAAVLGALTAVAAAGVEHPATLAAPLGSLTATTTAAVVQQAVLQALLGGLDAHATAQLLIVRDWIWHAYAPVSKWSTADLVPAWRSSDPLAKWTTSIPQE